MIREVLRNGLLKLCGLPLQTEVEQLRNDLQRLSEKIKAQSEHIDILVTEKIKLDEKIDHLNAENVRHAVKADRFFQENAILQGKLAEREQAAQAQTELIETLQQALQKTLDEKKATHIQKGITTE